MGLVADNAVISVAMDDETENQLFTRFSASADVSSQMGKGSYTPTGIHDEENLESYLPGLDSSVKDDSLSRLIAVSALIPTGLDESIKDQSTSFGERSSLNLPTSVSTERSEDLSPKAPTSEANSIISSTATSVGLSHQLVLPKLLAPVINLADDEKDNLQKSAFNRVIEAYKHVLISGGAQLRSSLLAQLVVEVVILASLKTLFLCKPCERLNDAIIWFLAFLLVQPLLGQLDLYVAVRIWKIICELLQNLFTYILFYWVFIIRS